MESKKYIKKKNPNNKIWIQVHKSLYQKVQGYNLKRKNSQRNKISHCIRLTRQNKLIIIECYTFREMMILISMA